MESGLKAAVEFATRRLRENEKEEGKHLWKVLAWAFLYYTLMQAAANADILLRLWASSTRGTATFELKPFDYSVLKDWEWTAHIDSADATVVVTAALLYVATFNVAAIASALDRSKDLPVTLTQFWWRESAAAATRFAVAIAVAISLTRLPGEPGLAVGLTLLSALCGRGSQLVSGENMAAADRLVRVAYIHGVWKDSNKAVENALWGRAPTKFRFRVLTERPLAAATPWFVLLSALPVFALTSVLAGIQTLWSMSIMASPGYQGHRIDASSVFALWIHLDVAFILFPGLLLVGAMILGWIGQAHGLRSARFLVIVTAAFICAVLVLLNRLFQDPVHNILLWTSPWPFVLLVGLSLWAARTGKGICTPIPLTAMMILKKRQMARDARLEAAVADYAKWRKSHPNIAP